MKIIIDIKKIAKKMRELGYRHNGSEVETENGWTNDLMDILEEMYELEGNVDDALKRSK